MKSRTEMETMGDTAVVVDDDDPLNRCCQTFFAWTDGDEEMRHYYRIKTPHGVGSLFPGNDRM